jgi:hypothetical protein
MIKFLTPNYYKNYFLRSPIAILTASVILSAAILAYWNIDKALFLKYLIGIYFYIGIVCAFGVYKGSGTYSEKMKDKGLVFLVKNYAALLFGMSVLTYALGMSLLKTSEIIALFLKSLNDPTILIATLVLAVGVLLWIIRKKIRAVYGTIEVVVGVFTGYYSAPNFKAGAPETYLALAAAVYIVVRGMDNFDTGVNCKDLKDRDPIAKWIKDQSKAI